MYTLTVYMHMYMYAHAYAAGHLGERGEAGGWQREQRDARQAAVQSRPRRSWAAPPCCGCPCPPTPGLMTAVGTAEAAVRGHATGSARVAEQTTA